MKVFPVVHIKETETAVAQAKTALDLGADGVYLIDHHGTYDTVFTTLNHLRAERPNSYVGINLLGYTALDAVRIAQQYTQDGKSEAPSALWIDDIRGNGINPAELPKQMKDADPALQAMRILGGVAFKYTSAFTEDPEQAAREARTLFQATDVITTSGKGTGTAPSIPKIDAMKQAAEDKPLAVASGISLENIHDYESIVDEILVASSVETEPYSGIFDPKLLRAFIDQAHQLR